MKSMDDFHNVISDGDKIYLQSAPQTPINFIKEMVENSKGKQLSFYHEEISGDEYFINEKKEGIKDFSFFIGKNAREAYLKGVTSYIPIFLSEIPNFIENYLKPDLVISTVSSKDSHGNVSTGASVIGIRRAIETGKKIILIESPNIPRTFGDSTVKIQDNFIVIEGNEKIYPENPAIGGRIEQEIGENVSSIIRDRSVIQAGIGAVPNSALKALEGHRELGIHTELFSDGMLNLIEKGAVTNRYKAVDRDHSVSTFVKGTDRLYKYIDDNPELLLRSSEYTNDTSVIRRHKNMVSVNSAVQVDITGQVVAESIGKNIISGVGGQMDFIRGASLSEGGISIIAITSMTPKGISKIQPFIDKGAGVTTTRAHVDYIVTENGIAKLKGKDLRERAREMIKISHPNFKDTLEKYAREIFPGF
ncbi:acetyl-CoA hydrolase/transferase family protein [Caldiplasma sukawensis]